jgi:hypothetical protein
LDGVVTDYIQREARNRSLGSAGELFTLNYERARLIHAGKENLASRIEHTSQLCGDGAGYDVLSFEESGRERLIEVKTTKYGADTPFFVSKNEVSVSEQESDKYHVIASSRSERARVCTHFPVLLRRVAPSFRQYSSRRRDEGILQARYAVSWPESASDRPVIVGVAPYPEPKDTGRYVHAQCAI